MGIFWKMIFGYCVETWEISYNRSSNNNILKDFGFFLEDFFFIEDYNFLHGEIFE